MRTLIAVPCHEYIHADFARCLMELDKPEGTGFAMITNTLIHTARNMIAEKAVQMFDRVLWLDSDMVFPADTLVRLAEDMDKGLDYVTAICYTRKEPSVPVIYKDLTWRVEDCVVHTCAECFKDYPRDSLFEVAASGMGCCMMSVELLRDMVARYGQPFWPLMGMGEDTTFCFRAGQTGYKMFCDSRVKVGHIGQRIFTEV